MGNRLEFKSAILLTLPHSRNDHVLVIGRRPWLHVIVFGLDASLIIDACGKNVPFRIYANVVNNHESAGQLITQRTLINGSVQNLPT